MNRFLSVVFVLAVVASAAGCKKDLPEFDQLRSVNYSHMKDGTQYTVTLTNIDGDIAISRSTTKDGVKKENEGPMRLSAETFDKVWRGALEIEDITSSKGGAGDSKIDSEKFHFIGIVNAKKGVKDPQIEAFFVPAGEESDEFKAWVEMLLTADK